MVMALQPSATQTSHHQLVSKAALLSPLPINPWHTWISCHLSPLTLDKCCNMKSVARYNALLVNQELGKITEHLIQYRLVSSAPKSGYIQRSCPPASKGSQICGWKLFPGSTGFPLFWQPTQFCHFITGVCIPLQSKTNNHRVHFYIRSLTTSI